MRKQMLFMLLGGLLALALVGCAEEAKPAGASITGATLIQEQSGEVLPFMVEVTGDNLPVGVEVRGTVTRGALRAEIRDSADRAVWSAPYTPPTPLNAVVRLPNPGQYKLGLVWEGPITASYGLRWQPGAITPPTVTPLALLAGGGMTLIALGFILYAARKRLGWGYLGLGAAGWLVGIVCKFAWAIPLNGPIYTALHTALSANLAEPIFEVYVGLLTGVFEILLVWPLLRYTRLGRVGWPRALAFGLGAGALEALLLGLSSLGTALVGLLAPQQLTYEIMENLARQNNLLWGLAPLVERLATILVHTLARTLLFQGVQTRQARWLWFAVALMTALDTVAAWGQLHGINTLAMVWRIEGVIALFGALSYVGLRWLARHYGERQPSVPSM
jgi:uncharacterized membrane protein YhfC